jgi:hypothetical protein
MLGLGMGRTKKKANSFTSPLRHLTRSVCRHLRFLGPTEAIEAVGVSGFLSCGDQAAHELSQPCGELELWLLLYMRFDERHRRKAAKKGLSTR